MWGYFILDLLPNTMKTTLKHDQRMAKMTFASVYPHYVTKIEKKGRMLTKQGTKKLDVLATEILKEKIVDKPHLSIYR